MKWVCISMCLEVQVEVHILGCDPNLHNLDIELPARYLGILLLSNYNYLYIIIRQLEKRQSFIFGIVETVFTMSYFKHGLPLKNLSSFLLHYTLPFVFARLILKFLMNSKLLLLLFTLLLC